MTLGFRSVPLTNQRIFRESRHLPSELLPPLKWNSPAAIFIAASVELASAVIVSDTPPAVHKSFSLKNFKELAPPNHFCLLNSETKKLASLLEKLPFKFLKNIVTNLFWIIQRIDNRRYWQKHSKNPLKYHSTPFNLASFPASASQVAGRCHPLPRATAPAALA